MILILGERNMQKEYFEYKLPAILWLPESEPLAVVQVVHGMTEHLERYETLAETLTEHGIAVVGFDLRGHGKTSQGTTCASLGENGWNYTLQEIQEFHQLIKERFAHAKHYLLGFSLGSFLVREYFSINGCSDFAGAIIMGTGQQPAFLLSVILMIVKGEIKKAGFDQTTELVRTLSFGTYNKKFAPNRTKADWLCSDTDELDKYIADELSKEDISAGLFYELLDSMKRLANPNTYDKWNKEMPVLLLSGESDPVGDFGKGVKLVKKSMKKAGMKNVSCKMYEGGRHDILHEVEKGIAKDVCEQIKEFIL